MNNIRKKFVASYSGGKDSMLAIYRAIQMGMEPVALIITFNTDKKESWFHGVPEKILQEVSKSLNIPIRLIQTDGEDYAYKFEKELLFQKEQGVEVCIFGDIDIEEHLEWCKKRCEVAGIKAFFPLWKEDRKVLVEEFIDRGFKANITVVDTTRLSEKHLGMCLCDETISSIVLEGADACGENGEYHTFVSDGPLFSYPIPFTYKDKFYSNHYAILPIQVKV